MSNNVVPISSNLPAELAGVIGNDFDDDLSSGIQGGFAVVSIRGSKWRVKHGGEEELLTNDDGDPIAGLEVVLVKANKNLSHIYYEGAYEEGSKEAPDCFSLDGIKPDAGSPNKQCKTCAACPQQVWGSKISPAGKKIKACQDARRVAVVPAGDIPNKLYGGPMLLRVPAASLTDLKLFNGRVKAKGAHYMTVATRLTFDPDASYPKLVFKAKRKLNSDQLNQLAEHYKGDMLERMLNEAPEFDNNTTQEAKELEDVDSGEHETATDTKASEDAAKKAAAAKKRKAAAEKKKADAIAAAAGDDLDDDLDAPDPVKADKKEAAPAADNTAEGADDDLDDLINELDD